MEQKTYRGTMEFKAAKPGEFLAHFATLGVVDRDDDVTQAGAFQEGQNVLIEAWNHNYGQLPVGKAVVREEGDKAIADGTFFLDTLGGMEHYKTVKNLGDLQEWSYTFYIDDSGYGEFEGKDVRFLRKLDVIGVSPVDRGAGIGTGTVAIKTHPGADAVTGGAGDDGKSAADEETGKSETDEAVTSSGRTRSRLAARFVFSSVLGPSPDVRLVPLEGRHLVRS